MKRLYLAAAAAVFAGCASMGAQYVPLVDGTGDPVRWAADLAECQSLAAKRIDAERFAVAGAVVTGLLGAFFAPHGLRNEAFAVAATVGAFGGAGEGIGTQQDIIKRCLSLRGYAVLH